MRLCFLSLLLHQISSQIIPNSRQEDGKTFADCVSSIVASNTENYKLAIWYSKENEVLLSEILKKVQVPVVLNVVESFIEHGIETRVSSNIVVVLSSVKIKYVLQKTLWTGQTQFLLVNYTMNDILKGFEHFWNFKVVNVFGMTKEGDDVLVYSFLPYGKENCDSVRPFLVEKYVASIGNFMYNGNAFKDPVRIKNMYGCRANVTIVNVKPNVIFKDECNCNATTHIQGIEGKLMVEVAKKLNFNATFVIALDGIGWGWIHPSPHGAVGEVFTGRSDFAIGLLAPTMERFESLDLSLPYNGEECITYGVPTGARASTPNWITILTFEFSIVTWVLILLTFIILFTVLRIMNEISKETWSQSRIDTVLYLFSSCLGLPVKVPSYLSLRLSLMFWLIFSFVVTVGYRSSMGSKLTVPNKDPDINTFKELLDSRLELTGYNNMLRLLQYNDSEPNIKKMVARFKVTDFDIEYAVDRIAAERKIAHVRHSSTFLYYALISPKAKGYIHIIKDCIMLYHPIIVTKKHSPFSYRLNQLISRLMESGLTKRWRAEYIYNVPPPPKPFLKLSKDNMYGVFCILCFGYIIGGLVFVSEVISSCLLKKKKK